MDYNRNFKTYFKVSFFIGDTGSTKAVLSPWDREKEVGKVNLQVL